MSTMYHQPLRMPSGSAQNDSDVFDDSSISISPTQALFPPELFAPGSYPSNNSNAPKGPSFGYKPSLSTLGSSLHPSTGGGGYSPLAHRQSISSVTSDYHPSSSLSAGPAQYNGHVPTGTGGTSYASGSNYGSRLPSLSPSSTASVLMASGLSAGAGSTGLATSVGAGGGGVSPHSSASPRSAFSYSAPGMNVLGAGLGDASAGDDPFYGTQPYIQQDLEMDMFFAMDRPDLGLGTAGKAEQENFGQGQGIRGGGINFSQQLQQQPQQQQPVFHFPKDWAMGNPTATSMAAYTYPYPGNTSVGAGGRSNSVSHPTYQLPNAYAAVGANTQSSLDDTFDMLNLPDQDISFSDLSAYPTDTGSVPIHTQPQPVPTGTASAGNHGGIFNPSPSSLPSSTSTAPTSRRFSVVSTESYPVHVRADFRNTTDTTAQARQAAQTQVQHTRIVEEMQRRQVAQDEVIRQVMLESQQTREMLRMSQMGQMLQPNGAGALTTIAPSWMNLPASTDVGGGSGKNTPPASQAGTGGVAYATADSTEWPGIKVPSLPAQSKAATGTGRPRGRPCKNPRPAPAPAAAAAAASSAKSAASASSASPPEQPPQLGATGGKHNKTERRYRQKVQAAQAQLRDAVPALRVLYGTSTPEQKAATDFKAEDGTVDGLGEVSRPNASAKATIFVGARMYIELLQDRVASMQRKVAELEAYRLEKAGETEMAKWQKDFEGRERALAELRKQQQAEDEGEDDDASEDGSEEEEEAQQAPKKRKKPSASASTKAKGGSDGVRVFAAFAMSFSLVPSASTMLRHQPAPHVPIVPGRVLSGEATPTEIIARLPLITAEHVHELAKRVLPHSVVPGAGTMVDWTWRLLVAGVLVLVLGPLFGRWSKDEGSEVERDGKKEEKRLVRAGNLVGMARDALGFPKNQEEDAQWVRYAEAVVGRLIEPTRLERLHLLIRLSRSASLARSAHPLALLALLQPPAVPIFPSAESAWSTARSLLSPSDPPALHSTLSLPLSEAHAALGLLRPTASPIEGIADQIALVHLHDLYTRLFVRLVDATTAAPPAHSSSSTSPKQTTPATLPISLSALYDNLRARNLRSDLTAFSFDAEIRTVLASSRAGTPAYALALVLTGLWGVFTGPRPEAQAALVSALAREEMAGAASGSGLESVSGMIELLYPGASLASSLGGGALGGHAGRVEWSMGTTQNALALDKLAGVCIGYIRLLSQVDDRSGRGLVAGAEAGAGAGGEGGAEAREAKAEVSRAVGKAVAELRMIISETAFVGLDAVAVEVEGEDEDELDDDADADADGDSDQEDHELEQDDRPHGNPGDTVTRTSNDMAAGEQGDGKEKMPTGQEKGARAVISIDHISRRTRGEGVMGGERRKLEEAKERLVAVLSIIGRRAAGRCAVLEREGEGEAGMGGEDSGLEGDMDEI